MPIQAATQWTEYLNCPVCEHGFDLRVRQPISLGCGHTICKTCLFNLQRNQCPFDLGVITVEVERLPINTALMLLIEGVSSRTLGSPPDLDSYRNSSDPQVISLMKIMESMALFLKPSSSLSRSMQRKLITLINCQLMEDEGRLRAARAARSLGERTVTELILHHQNPQQLSANLWAAVRGRGCQFLGPAMQEEVLALVLLALEDGEALSRKVLVMYVVQRLESQFPQASKTSIGHVVQLLYRASCFKVTKREGDSSLMQLKEEFRTYDALRREHDMQIVQIATEAGLRIAPDQWSSLLYGDTHHKSQMQSIMDKLQTPESFSQSVQELVIALQKTGDPGKLTELRPSLDFLAGIDPAQDTFLLSFDTLKTALLSVNKVLTGLVTFVSLHSSKRSLLTTSSGGCSSTPGASGSSSGGNTGSGGSNSGGHDSRHHHARYKTNLCRDLSVYGFCPRGKNCTFAHSLAELEQHRSHHRKSSKGGSNHTSESSTGGMGSTSGTASSISTSSSLVTKNDNGPFRGRSGPPANAPVAQVAPLPRVRKQSRPPNVVAAQQISPSSSGSGSNAGGGHIQFHVISDVFGHPVPFNPSEGSNPSPAVIQYAAAPSPHFHPFIDGGERGGGGGGRHKEFLISEEPLNKTSLCLASAGDIPSDDIIKTNSKQLEDEIVSKSIARIATKSLSALQSRKEEIIDTLEDLMGKDEASKLSQEFEELSFQNKASEGAGGLQVLEAQINTSVNASSSEFEPTCNSIYSMWTTKSIVSLATKNYAEAAAAVAHEQAIHDGLESRCSVVHEKDERGVWSVFHQGMGFRGLEDDICPLPDVPLVSRFGPISRRCNTLLKPTVPSQTQASIDDDTVPTDVVTNSKQMTHQIPSMTSPWFYQNGIMSVQPVAVGPNGELGYILVADQPSSSPLLLQNPLRSMMNTIEPDEKESLMSGAAPKSVHDTAGDERGDPFSGREILSSSLSSSNSSSEGGGGDSKYSGFGGIFDPHSPVGVNQIRQDQLSNELFLIENSIRDREREISINHMQELHHRGALDYGSYISQGLISKDDEEEESASLHAAIISFQSASLSGGISGGNGGISTIQSMSGHFRYAA